MSLFDAFFDFLLALDTPPRIDAPELIDDDAQPYTDLRASMHDVRRVNHFLGGTSVVTRQAGHWLRAYHAARSAEAAPDSSAPSRPSGSFGPFASPNATGSSGASSSTGSSDSSNSSVGEPLRFLDVATGSGDIPEALLALAARIGVAVEIVGLDYSAPILRYAREEVGGREAIRLVRGDAFHLPFADNSFDYALCSLAFHHWGFTGCVNALREMERVTRRGWLVNDLRRAWSAWVLIRLVMAFANVNRLTRHDAPASVLRAYSLPEYRAMPAALNLTPGRDVRIRRSLFYRVALVREK